jgi:hypothetical protein
LQGTSKRYLYSALMRSSQIRHFRQLHKEGCHDCWSRKRRFRQRTIWMSS